MPPVRTTEQTDDGDSDGDETTELHSTHPFDGSARRVRPCPHCENGNQWATGPALSELVCDRCFVVEASVVTEEVTDMIVSEEVVWPDHDDYDSGEARLAGGYSGAYIAGEDGDKEYTLDGYDEVTDGLWTPHLRQTRE